MGPLLEATGGSEPRNSRKTLKINFREIRLEGHKKGANFELFKVISQNCLGGRLRHVFPLPLVSGCSYHWNDLMNVEQMMCCHITSKCHLVIQISRHFCPSFQSESPSLKMLKYSVMSPQWPLKVVPFSWKSNFEQFKLLIQVRPYFWTNTLNAGPHHLNSV